MRCDSHVHIVGPPDRFPQTATRTYFAGPARLDDLQRRGAAHGITRFVIVQPSFYGTDNSATLEALDALGGNGRAVAVVDPGTTRDTLAQLDRRGVRGLRLNLYSAAAGRGVRTLDAPLAALAALAKPFGWHVEVIAPIAVLVAGADAIRRAPTPVVIDHYGVYDREQPESEHGRMLLALMREPHVWMKLSAPYRVSNNPLETKPDRAWLAAILAAAPGRCVWGSDWPFTPPHEDCNGPDSPAPYRTIDYDTMVGDFLAAVGSSGLAERVMVDNAARLYGFA